MTTKTTPKTTTPDLRDPGSTDLPAASAWTVEDAFAVQPGVAPQLLTWLERLAAGAAPHALFLPVTGPAHPWVCPNPFGDDRSGLTFLQTGDVVELLTTTGRLLVASRTVQ